MSESNGWSHRRLAELRATSPRIAAEPTGRRAYVIAPVWRPTFYLLADVQGLTSEAAAEAVARDIMRTAAGPYSGPLTVTETRLP